MSTSDGPEDRSPDAPADPRDPVGRLAELLNPGSMRLLGSGSGDVVVAWGRAGDVPAVAFCCDARMQGGALGGEGCEQIVRAYDLALRERLPIIGVWHSGGARLAEGVGSLHGVGQVFAAMTRASGVVPQVSVVVGPAAGGAAYGPALTDVVVMAASGRLFVTGPDVVESVTGERLDMEALGGPEQHGTRSGVAHVVAATEEAAYREARRLATLLARQGLIRTDAADVDLSGMLPVSPRRAYDVRPLVVRLLDEPGVELHPRWAPNIVTTLGRFAGRTVGVVANNPVRLGGCLDALSADKAARFVRMCDAFGVPLVVLVDVPGYLPGARQEHEGVVRRGAKLVHAFAECTVPRVTVIIRKAYGGAYIAMNSRALGATRVLAWPGAEIGVMSATAAVRVLGRRRLAEASEHERASLEARLAAEHAERAGGLGRALELGVVDEIVEPAKTRGAVRRALAEARPGRGAHRNIPL
ncbi:MULTISPECIES: carboxyl transferase domain-containing protein [unclassified Nonomuraea]|uniref:carboxyl transferase domain-containing protein n=1 Tax=unclassified Nonomuraea TaxID=2593643 RepID=UPI00207BA59B|nr:carboxyl transferase domain-containing protein [Nonomuraea sp. KC401]